MTRTVVCISHAAGAGGEEVGRLVAERLGFLYVNEEIVARAAAKGGVDAADVADEERRKSLAARALNAIAQGGGQRRHPVTDPRDDRADRGARKGGDRRACRLLCNPR